MPPLGQGLALGELDAEELLDERRVPEGISKSDKPGGQLQVEEIPWHFPGPKPAQSDFFPPRVDDYLHGRIDDELPESIKRPDGERVDQEELLESGDLDQTETRMVTILADEFRVEAEAAAGRQVFAAGRELLGLDEDLFGQDKLLGSGCHNALSGYHEATTAAPLSL